MVSGEVSTKLGLKLAVHSAQEREAQRPEDAPFSISLVHISPAGQPDESMQDLKLERRQRHIREKEDVVHSVNLRSITCQHCIPMQSADVLHTSKVRRCAFAHRRVKANKKSETSVIEKRATVQTIAKS